MDATARAGCDQHWVGASPEAIEALEEYGSRSEVAETLRESLARTGFAKFRRQECSYKATGIMRYSGSLLEILDPVLVALQFSKVMPAGSFWGIYDRADIGVEVSITPSEAQEATQPFMLFETVANDEATIRSVLGTIDTETPVEVKVDKWVRPLQ